MKSKIEQMKALDEVIKYLDDDNNQVVNEIELGAWLYLLFIKYGCMLVHILILSVPFIISGELYDIRKDKKRIKNILDNLNQFSKQYASIGTEAMPNYGKYISSRNIDRNDIYNNDTKSGSFDVSLLEFDLTKFKKDFEDKENLKSIALEAEKEYVDAICKVKKYFDTKGCPEIIKFDEMALNKSFVKINLSDAIVKGVVSDETSFYLGNISLHYGEDIKKLKISKELRKVMESNV